ncbi:MAG: succinate dehydrogenase/fumarate reductase transmembrane subunit [Candidatus Limnocylindrales bacterium]|nr:succinate dehydrogenase [Chloroflexota bacterium]
MAIYSRSGRRRPSGGGFELFAWYLMRITGLGLFVLALAHFLILHVLYDPSQENATFIAHVRWSSLFWRVMDWSLLMLVLFHAFLGVRTVIGDYAKGGTRMFLLTALYLLGFALFVAGTSVVLTLPGIVPPA